MPKTETGAQLPLLSFKRFPFETGMGSGLNSRWHETNIIKINTQSEARIEIVFISKRGISIQH